MQFFCTFISAFDRLAMNTAIESFDRHGLRAQNDKLIDIPDMTTVLHSLYVTIEPIDMPLMLDLAINWILNVYDSQRTGQIRVLSFKVRLNVFSKCQNCITFILIHFIRELPPKTKFRS